MNWFWGTLHTNYWNWLTGSEIMNHSTKPHSPYFFIISLSPSNMSNSYMWPQHKFLTSYLQVTAFACSTGSIGIQHTCGCIAARVVTVALHSTVALFTSLHKSIPTHWTIKQAGKETNLVMTIQIYTFT